MNASFVTLNKRLCPVNLSYLCISKTGGGHGEDCPAIQHGFGRTEKRLGHFRRALRKQDQELFDELLERARLHVQAAVKAANPEPMESIFISVLIEMLKAEKRLQARVEELEKELRFKDAKR